MEAERKKLVAKQTAELKALEKEIKKKKVRGAEGQEKRRGREKGKRFGRERVKKTEDNRKARK